MFGIENRCGILQVLGLVHFWGLPLELVPVPDLECAPDEWVEVNCCVLEPLEADGPYGAVAIFPPLENGCADASVLVLVIFVGYIYLPTLYKCPSVL